MLRPSSMDLFFKCGMSSNPEGLPEVDDVGPEAHLGSFVHEMIAATIRGVPIPKIPEGMDKGQVDMLYEAAIAAWGAIESHFPAPKTEVRLESDTFGGTLDVVSIEGHAFIDWKTGRLEESYEHQMRAYAALFLKNYGTEYVTAYVVHLRERYIDKRIFTKADVIEWAQKLQLQLKQADARTYRPGPHCSRCKLFHSCSVREEATGAAITALALCVTPDGEAGPVLTTQLPEDPKELGPYLADMRAKIKYIESLARKADAAIRDLVFTKGPFPTSDGKVLGMTKSSRRTIDPINAWPLIRAAGLKDEQIAEACTLSTTKLENAIKANAEQGDKAKVAREFFAELDKAGAIERKEVWSLRETARKDKTK